jgi:hypothetical protein
MDVGGGLGVAAGVAPALLFWDGDWVQSSELETCLTHSFVAVVVWVMGEGDGRCSICCKCRLNATAGRQMWSCSLYG